MDTATEQRTKLDSDRKSSPARRPALLLAVAAGLCWACAFAMLLSANLEATHALLAPARAIFYALVLLAGLQYLRSRGAGSITLGVDAGNPAPVNLYKSVGFRTISSTEAWDKTLTPPA